MQFTFESQQAQYKKSAAVISGAVVLHLLVAYAIINGTASQVIKVITSPIETRIIEEIKPPPPPPPPPQQIKIEAPKARVKPPPAYVPPPEVQVNVPVQNTIAAVSNTPEPVAPVPAAAEPAPAPAVAKVGVACPNSGQIRASLEYPRQALKDNVTGKVLVQFLVDAAGKTRDFTLIHAAHPLLNRAALDAAQRFGCVGQGRDVLVQVPFDFKLE